MDNLIVISDFKTDWALPNASAPIMATKYTGIITESQDKFLKELLGYSFFKEMQTAFDVEDPAVPPTIWSDFVNGCEYTENGVLKYFDGLKSLLIKAMWYEIIQSGLVYVGSNGLAVATLENSEATDPTMYIFNRWGLIFQEIKTVYAFLDLHSDTYPSYEKSTKLKIKSFL